MITTTEDENEKNTTPMLLCIDWSGTVSDDAALCHAASLEMGKLLGFAVVPDVTTWMRNSASSAHAELEKLGKRISNVDVAKYHLDCLNHALDSDTMSPPEPLPGAIEALHKIHRLHPQLPIFIISAHPRQLLINDAKRFGILDAIGGEMHIMGGCSNKTNCLEMLWSEYREQFGSWRSNVIYIGDTEGDMLAAKRFGATSYAVTCGYHTLDRLRAAQPDVIVPSLDVALHAIHLKMCGE